MNESAVDNALVHQKDALRSEIMHVVDNCLVEPVENQHIIIAKLVCIRELWYALDYGYKFKELIKLGVDLCDQKLSDMQESEMRIAPKSFTLVENLMRSFQVLE